MPNCRSPILALLGAFLSPAALSAQDRFAVLEKTHHPAAGQGNQAMATADIDGDGDTDYAVAGPPGEVRFWLNDGAAGFRPGPVLTDTTWFLALAFADVDGDRDPDLVVTSGGAQNRLYLNQSGQFSDATVGRLPTSQQITRSLVFGDVDGDGDADLIFGNEPPAANQLLLNDGSGRFQDATTGRLADVSAPTQALCLADLDGDGDLDLYCGLTVQDALFFNDGRGRFTNVSWARLPVAIAFTLAVEAVDVDGDGDRDLLLARSGVGNGLFRNDGAGTFADASAMSLPQTVFGATDVAARDLDGDGDQDCVFATIGFNQLFWNDGRGTFRSAPVTQFPAPRLIGPRQVTLEDFDANGTLDVIDSRHTILLNDGARRFVDVTASPLTRRVLSVANEVVVGDVNADGLADVFVADERGFDALFLGQVGGGFLDVTIDRLPRRIDSSQCAAFGDVDGDGDLDLFVGTSLRENRLLLNDGTGKFADAPTGRLRIGSGFRRDALFLDVDGDRDLDLLVFGSPRNELWLNAGNGAFTDASSQLPTQAETTERATAADVDRDGDPDLVLANGGGARQNRVLVNDGTGRFRDETASRLPTEAIGSLSVDAGDVDGDGDPDLIFGTARNDRLYRNDGAGRFVSAAFPSDVQFTRGVRFGDADGDGDLDLATAGGQGWLYLNDGNGAFLRDRSFQADFDRDVVWFDPDGDGDLDLTAGVRTIWTNRTRQVFVERAARLGRPLQLSYFAIGGMTDAVVYPFASLERSRTPIDLGPRGVWTLALPPVVAEFPPVIVPRASGTARQAVPLPNLPFLQGQTLFVQAFVAPGAGRTDGRLTGVYAERLLR